MAGILYGIGVGPGDPELMTLKAANILKRVAVIGLPNKEKDSCVAYQIARTAVPELEDKFHLCMEMPMVKDLDILAASYEKAAADIIGCLKKGQDVGLITLGDSTIYSTCMHVMDKIEQAGFETVYVSGIPSFCAVAARLNLPLASRDQELHIIPASYQIEQALKLPGVKVLMKMGKNLSKVKQLLKEQNCDVRMIECCGMEQERIYDSIDQIPEQAKYYSLLIVW